MNKKIISMPNLIRLGNKCNQDCIFCTVALDQEKELTTEGVENRIQLLAKRNARAIIFTGGEPTLREDLAELIKFAKKSGIESIELQTNGVLLDDPERAERIVDAGVDSALVSLHSHRKEISEKLTHSINTFERTLKGINNLSGLCSVSISHVINSLNYRDLRDFARFIRERFPKVRYIYLSLVRPNGNALKNKWIVPKISDIDLDLYNAFRYYKSIGVEFGVEGLPLCYMQGFEEYSVEVTRLLSEPAFYVSSKEFKADTHHFAQEFLKKKDERCEYCSVRDICPGVWREYADIYGTAELFPVFVSKNEIVEKIRKW